MAAIVLPLVWGMAGHLMAADDADKRRSTAGPGTEVVRQVVYSSQLRANFSNAERYVVKGVCERDGIREIASILERADFEEMWAFLPRAHGTEDCQWHEIGREERSERDRSTLRVDMGYLAGLMAENTEIRLVHFHPRRYFECAVREDCQKQAAAGQAAAFDKRWITDLVYSMPSPSDVHFMMNVTSRFFRRHQVQGTIRHKVVTPYGVVDYGLTDKGLARYDAERNGRTEGLYIAWVAASALDNDRVELVVKDNPLSISAAVQQLAQTLNTDFLRVELEAVSR
ncbi:MAG: hypothetical protein ACREVP_04895 [Burkholderiales bacterium]